MSRKFKSTYVHVTVERGENEHIATTVLAHEIPCLQAKHGEGSVKIVNDVPKDVLDYARVGKKVELDRDEEWVRLMSSYGMHPNFDMETVAYVYQNNKRSMTEFDLDEFIADTSATLNSENIEAMLNMLEDFDVEVDSERPAKVESQLRELICEKLDEEGVENYRSNDDIKVLMGIASAVLLTDVVSKKSNIDKNGDGDITIPEIKEKLDVLDVKYKSNDDKATLLSLLIDSIQDQLSIYEVEFEDGDAVEVLWSKMNEHENSIKTGDSV